MAMDISEAVTYAVQASEEAEENITNVSYALAAIVRWEKVAEIAVNNADFWREIAYKSQHILFLFLVKDEFEKCKAKGELEEQAALEVLERLFSGAIVLPRL
jgi:hypothetical protein